jgi:predicted NAD/FAD-binding protein
VIGSGLAGLSAAWWLSRTHRVTVFERQSQPGFTAANVDLPGHRPAARVDVPLRVFYPGYYPTLQALYDELGVATEPVDYAATLYGADGLPYFRYRNLRWGDRSIGFLAPRDWLLGRTARRIVAGLVAWRRASRLDGAVARSPDVTLGEFVARCGLPREFVDGFLLPAVATICTCTFEQARRYPASVVMDYAARGVASQSVRRVSPGADDVLRRLVAGLEDLRCDARIASVQRVDEGRVRVRHEDGREERFDLVVFAVPPPVARRLLVDASADETAVLGAFRTTLAEVVTHRDPGLMPARRRDWSPVNLHVVPDRDTPEATIWLNAVQPSLRGGEDVFQTVHPHRAPRMESVLGRSCFERPVVDPDSLQALPRLARLHAEPGRVVWFCGSYAQSGIPLLESAVRSARVVVTAIDAGRTSGRAVQPSRRPSEAAA